MSKQADVCHRMPGRVQTLQLDGTTHTNHIALLQTAVHAADTSGRIRMSQNFRACRSNESGIAPGMVAMLVRVQDLRDLPALGFGGLEHTSPFQRVNGERLARFRASNQVMKIPQPVGGPDSLDQHGKVRSYSRTVYTR